MADLGRRTADDRDKYTDLRHRQLSHGAPIATLW